MAFKKGEGGRPRGIFNKKSSEALEIAHRIGIDPFETLCLMAKGDWEALGYKNEVYVKETEKGAYTLGYTITPEMRLNAAREACKYLYAQKKENDFTPQEIKIIELYRERLALSEQPGVGDSQKLLGKPGESEQ